MRLGIETLRTLPISARVGMLVAVTALLVALTLMSAPIPQNPAYHAFADTRAFCGIPNFVNSLSNVGFLIVGVWGLATVWNAATLTSGLRRSSAIFFLGVALTSLGSAYYHLAPDNQTLFWDRLPMTVAFMALLAVFIGDRIDERSGKAILPILLALGALSLVYWERTEAAGHGDLRPYLFVQYYTIVAVPLICLLFEGRHTHAKYVLYMVLWYGIALVFDRSDKSVDAMLDSLVSGHTIKHVLAAASAYMALAMFRNAASAPSSGYVDAIRNSRRRRAA